MVIIIVLMFTAFTNLLNGTENIGVYIAVILFAIASFAIDQIKPRQDIKKYKSIAIKMEQEKKELENKVDILISGAKRLSKETEQLKDDIKRLEEKNKQLEIEKAVAEARVKTVAIPISSDGLPF